MDQDGFSALDGDCDDSRADINPDAVEVCDGEDNDCDGAVDDDDPDVADTDTWYLDNDGDGYGDAGSSIQACDQPGGAVPDDTDCDDEDAEVHPGANELCNGHDDDCDEAVDDDDPDIMDAGTWYTDGDGDEYGDPESPVTACEQPTGTVEDATDCDDSASSIHPGVSEVCDEIDENCDGEVDNDPVAGETWYPDADADGFGITEEAILDCGPPEGYSAVGGDCDDEVALINPDAIEVCDLVDNDCDSLIDPDSVCVPPSWGCRQTFPVDNDSSEALTDFQVRLVVDTSALIDRGKMREDCGDLRVTGINGTFLPYWLEPGTCDTAESVVWARLREIPDTGTVALVYYGNVDAGDQSSTETTFLHDIPEVEAAWDLDEMDGYYAEDGSGNGNRASLVNGPVWTEGVFDGAIDLDGLNDYLVTNDLKYEGGEMSLRAWVRRDSTETGQSNIFSNPWNGAGEYNYRFGTSSGSLTFQVLGSGSRSVTSGNGALPTDSWHQVVATVGPAPSEEDAIGTMRLYVDGLFLAENSHSITDWTPPQGDSGTPLALGTLYPYGGGWGGHEDYSFGGTIDQMRLYRHVLTGDEVADLAGGYGYVTPNYPGHELVVRYNADVDVGSPFPEECPALVAHWTFDEGSGDVARDSGPSGYDGTLGTDTPSPDAPHWWSGDGCVSGSCLVFDGQDDLVWIDASQILPVDQATFTISSWVNTTSSRSSLFGQYASPGVTGSDTSHFMSINEGTMMFDEYPPSGGGTPSDGLVNDGTWHQLTIVVRGDIRELYVDGLLDARGVQEHYAGAAPDVVWLGARYYSGYSPNDSHSPFDGWMDEVRVYDYARSPLEVEKAYLLDLEAMEAICEDGTCRSPDQDEDGWSVDDGDCNDNSPFTHPGAEEACDQLDNDCDGVVGDEAPGSSSECPAINCKAILQSDAAAEDGVYWIDPDPGTDPFPAWCDMTTDDGGWTLLITLTRSTVTFETVEDWPTEIALTGDEPDSAGMYKGSLASFGEVREEVASGKVVVYGRNKNEAELEAIRQLYGYNSRMTVASLYSEVPACRLDYDGESDDLVGCSRYGSYEQVNSTTIIGWVVDPNDTYSSHCWFARGNCCSTAGGSSQCIGDPDGTKWARTWFR